MSNVHCQTPRALLSAVADFFEEDNSRWTQGRYAKTSQDDGMGTSISSPDAHCFCSLGAIYKMCLLSPTAVSIEIPDVTEDAKKLLEDALGGQNIVMWNDKPYRTVKEVIGAFREAAARLPGDDKLLEDL